MDILAASEVKKEKEMNGAESGSSPGDGDRDGSGKHCLSSRSLSSFCFLFLITCFRVPCNMSNLLVVDGSRVGVVLGVMRNE